MTRALAAAALAACACYQPGHEPCRVVCNLIDGSCPDGTACGDDGFCHATGEPMCERAAYSSVVAGDRHTCAIRAGGQLDCWGDNTFGQVGVGQASGVGRPTQVDEGPWVGVSAGAEHTCGVKGGELYCWGNGDDGRLGSTAAGADMPVRVGADSFGAVSAGGFHTCAISVEGRVHCWGRNDDGQLGDGTTAPHAEPAPIDLDRSDFVAVSAGLRHTCAVTGGGELYCWGHNEHGQVGDGTRDPRPTPTVVPGGWSRVAAGGVHTCAGGLSSLFCWGLGEDGALGTGNFDDQLTPAPVVGAAFWSAFATGYAHTCGEVGNEHAVWCWGINDSGQARPGGAFNEPIPGAVDTPASPGSNAPARPLAAGRSHTCAIRDLYAVHCWGADDAGQLGDDL